MIFQESVVLHFSYFSAPYCPGDVSSGPPPSERSLLIPPGVADLRIWSSSLLSLLLMSQSLPRWTVHPVFTQIQMRCLGFGTLQRILQGSITCSLKQGGPGLADVFPLCLSLSTNIEKSAQQLLWSEPAVGVAPIHCPASGTQWHPVAPSGTQWHPVAPSGTQWHLATPGKPYGNYRVFGFLPPAQPITCFMSGLCGL